MITTNDAGTTPKKGFPLAMTVYLSLAIIVVASAILLDFSWMTGISLPSIGTPAGWISAMIILIGILILSYVFRKKVSDSVSSKAKGLSLRLGNLAIGLLMTIGAWFLVWHYVLHLDDRTTTVVTETSCTTCAPADTRPQIMANQYQTLRAGVAYGWNRKCNTVYYFNPKEIGSTTLSYRYDRHPDQYLTGDIVRTERGPNFFAKEGQDPMVDGIYTVTVDKDVEVYVQTN